MEMQLTNFDRCRTIYQRYLLSYPDKPSVWINFAEMECTLEEHSRARVLYEKAITLPVLNMPETAWKAYIDMEIRLGHPEKARVLFERLKRNTKHIKVWIAFANFEKEQGEHSHMRRIYAEGYEFYKGKDDFKEHRKMLVEAWLEDEKLIGNEEHIKKVKSKLPREVIKQRKVTMQTEEGEEEEGHFEEYLEYIFPDD